MKRVKKGVRHIEKPIYHYWQAFYFSFFSSKLYVDVGKRWKGFGILYLFLIIALISIPFALRFTLDYNRYFDKQMLLPLKKIPLLYIQNGKVIFDYPMPYRVKNHLGQDITIIDTTGKITRIDYTNPFLSVLITQDKLIYRVPAPQLFLSKEPQKVNVPIYEHTLSKNINEAFNGESWVKASRVLRVKYLFDVILYPSIVVVFLFIYLTAGFVFSFMGQLIAQLFFRVYLTYKQSCRLLFVAATPQLIIFSIALTSNAPNHGFGLFSLILLFLYYCFGVLSLKRDSNRLASL